MSNLVGKYKFEKTDQDVVGTTPIRKEVKLPEEQKKPRTPAQLEAIRKLTEANKAKALARRGLMTEMPKPEEIPAGMRVVQVVKRPYNKTKPRYNEPIDEEKEVIVPPIQLPPYSATTGYTPYAQYPMPSYNVNGAYPNQYPPYYALPPPHHGYAFPSAIPAIQEKKVEKEKKKRGRKPSEKKKPTKARPYESTEEETTDFESGYDNETETETEPETDTEAVLKKTNARMKAIEAINARLAETNKGSKNRLSVFS
jgi:hypothetical protein